MTTAKKMLDQVLAQVIADEKAKLTARQKQTIKDLSAPSSRPGKPAGKETRSHTVSDAPRRSGHSSP